MTAEETPTPSDARKHLKVLVVDDDRDLTTTICTFLKTLSFEVFPSYDGPSALLLCKQHDPDLVVLDLKLPGMHGFDVGHALKKIRGLQGL